MAESPAHEMPLPADCGQASHDPLDMGVCLFPQDPHESPEPRASKHRLERVVWVDSGLSFASTWLDESTIVDRAKEWDGIVQTVGHVIYEDSKRLVLGLSYDKDNESWAGAFLIYKPAIVERYEMHAS